MNRIVAGPGQTFPSREVSTAFNFQALHKALPERYPFLLQSSAIGRDRGRFDILFAFPGQSLTLVGLSEIVGPGNVDSVDFLDCLDSWWRRERCDIGYTGLPFHGGWFLYLGYELAAQIEPTLNLQADPVLPTAFAVRCPAAFVRDHRTGKTFAVCESGDADQIESMCMDAASADAQFLADTVTVAVEATEEQPVYFLNAVRRAKEHIAAGDIFQANLSRSWRAVADEDLIAGDVYSRLCASNPAPFAGIAHWADTAIISSSPERLVSVRNGMVSTRPIAGTRPRGSGLSSDNAMADELFDHPKERAEHVMLIDLERNDLGRVCEPGSVEVDEFMVLESYAHVHHIVSNVSGKLREDVTPGQTIRAVFPGGTITGCPKVRCMEIIGNLERRPRGAYTGSFGYLNRDGSMDLNILIRTMVMTDKQIEFKAGSGIVADSDPEAELAESRAKAKGMLMALN